MSLKKNIEILLQTIIDEKKTAFVHAVFGWFKVPIRGG